MIQWSDRNNSNNKTLIKRYFDDISHIPLLSMEEEHDLAKKAKKWDDSAKSRLITGNLRLVISIAKRFIWFRANFSDLIQEGNMWLVKAIERLDPDRGYKFSTYATRWIKQNILNSLAEMSKNMNLPLHVRWEITLYSKKQQELFQKLGREPNQSELAKELWFTPKKLKYLEDIMFGNISLDKNIGDENRENLWDMMVDKSVLTPDERTEREFIKSNINHIFEMFDDRECKIVKMRRGIDGPRYTLEQIGEEFNITRERVRQIEMKVLEKVREHEGLRSMIEI